MAVDNTLWRAGWLTLAVAVICSLGLLLDTRQVGGVSTWLKPLKFALSVGVYLLTVALLLPLANVPDWRRTLLSWGIPLLIGGAFALIVLQGARGRQSHFNTTSPIDGAIFGGMGLLILGNTILLAMLTFDFFTRSTEVPSAFLWGIRLGLVSAVIGSVQGYAMIQRMAHTVGAPDGGPGLPLLNFSTIAGDLRIAHAIALHGLQILPLAGWWISRQQVPRGALLVFILFAAVMGFTALTWLQALSGKPLLANVQTPDASPTRPLSARRH